MYLMLKTNTKDVSEHESEEQSDEDSDYSEYDNSIADKYCEICDREFYTETTYHKHISEHRTCGIDGCMFMAHEKLVATHIKMQHSTGLYDKIRSVSTPEDIASWIADRKRCYPSKENVELRYKKQEEMIKRGERLFDRKKAFADRKLKFAVNTKKRKLRIQKLKTPKVKKISLINEKYDWNGEMFPFQGTLQLYKIDSSLQDNFDDSEWNETIIQKPNDQPGKIHLNNALGSLIGSYGSSDEADDKDLVKQQGVTIPSCNEVTVINTNPQSDDDVIEEMSSKIPLQFADVAPSTSKALGKSTQKKIYRKRKGQHTAPKIITAFEKVQYQKGPPTLLQKLLQKEIMHERNILLQCVRYIVNNQFFRSPKISN